MYAFANANKAAHFGFETQRRRHQKSKTGISVAHKKYFCPPKTLEKKSHIKAWIGGSFTHVAGRVFLDAALDNVHLTLAALTGRVVAR